MEQEQLLAKLSMEKSYYINKSIRSHPQRRLIAESLHELTDDEKMSDDIFALAMNIFDRFTSKCFLQIDDYYWELIALSCYNLAKKLRTNMSINNENERISFKLSDKNYNDEEIFNAEQLIAETLDWDLSNVVPHDYIQFMFQSFLPNEIHQAEIRLHVHMLLSIEICESNTLSILPSVLCCACIIAALKGLGIVKNHRIDELLIKKIECNKLDLIRTQHGIEKSLRLRSEKISPSPTRRCLAPIDMSNKTNASPRVK